MPSNTFTKFDALCAYMHTNLGFYWRKLMRKLGCEITQTHNWMGVDTSDPFCLWCGREQRQP